MQSDICSDEINVWYLFVKFEKKREKLITREWKAEKQKIETTSPTLNSLVIQTSIPILLSFYVILDTEGDSFF